MTKAEALQALDEGKKITHQHFTPNEYVQKKGNSYIFEDGVICTIQEFWKWRNHASWLDGWELFQEYTDNEMNCKGCMGPCGRCNKNNF